MTPGVQTGTGADTLLLRPGLVAALKEARSARCPRIEVAGALRVMSANGMAEAMAAPIVNCTRKQFSCQVLQPPTWLSDFWI